MDQEHEESWHMRIYNKQLPALVKLVLLVVTVKMPEVFRLNND